MASRMRSAVESYAKAHNISNEQATQELASRSTRTSAGMYGDAHAEWGVKPKILGVGGGLGVRGGGRAGIDWEDNDAHTASSNTQSSHNARHDIDARAHKTLKRPAITLPVARSVSPAAILTIMLIPVWISCLQP